MDYMALFASKDREYGKNKNKSVPYEEVLATDEADYKKLDWGASLLLGLEYQNYQFALTYYHGLYNIVYDGSPLYNRTLKLSVVYFF
jgi:hypothetical protein